MNLVSIIVPIYNTSNFISKCIDSLINQSYTNIEIILVNDGSTDDSELICKNYIAKDIRVQYHYKSNGGLSSARNFGIENAKGDYLSFVDSDDYVDKDFVKILLEACLENNTLISVCGRKVVYEKHGKDHFIFQGQQIWDSHEVVERLLTWNSIDGAACDKLFHRSVFDNLRFPIGRISEDLPVIVNILLKVKKIVHVGKPLYYYFQRKNSISRSGFSKNKLSVLDSSKEVQNMVIQSYPDLKKKADYYHFSHVLYLRELLVNREINFPLELTIINNEIFKNIYYFFSNPYVPFKRKVKFFLLNLNPFTILRKHSILKVKSTN